MLDNLAQKMAISIKNANQNETASIEVMTYSLGVLLNLLFTILLSLIVGVSFQKVEEMFIILFSFALLRTFSGGFHFKKSEYCVVASTLMAAVLSFLDLSYEWNFGLTAFSIILISLFAPYSKVPNMLIPVRAHAYLKLISVIIVGSNFFILSSLLTGAFLLQALTLINFRKRR